MRAARARALCSLAAVGLVAACADPSSDVHTGGATASAAPAPVCTNDSVCAPGTLCIDTACVDGAAWAVSVAGDRSPRLVAAREKIDAGSAVKRRGAKRAVELARAALAADGAFAWDPGAAWLGAATAGARPSFADVRFAVVADWDWGGSPPESLPRTPLMEDTGKLLADLRSLESRFAELAANDPPELKRRLAELDARLRMFEHSAAGMIRTPAYLVGFFRDQPLVGAPRYAKCETPPLRRTYAVYFYRAELDSVVLRITVRTDTREEMIFTPDLPCGEVVRTAAHAASVSQLTPFLRSLQKAHHLPPGPEAYVRTLY